MVPRKGGVKCARKLSLTPVILNIYLATQKIKYAQSLNTMVLAVYVAT